MSLVPNIIGNNQFPNPPIITGITKKKIIKKACLVTNTLKIWSLPIKDPNFLNSKRNRKLIIDPIIPKKYQKINIMNQYIYD